MAQIQIFFFFGEKKMVLNTVLASGVTPINLMFVYTAKWLQRLVTIHMIPNLTQCLWLS